MISNRSKAWKRHLAEKANRACGDCTACCTAIGVEELGKPYACPCHHLCGKGCGIYKDRPESCKAFGCLWLDGWAGPAMRPDKSGIILFFQKKTDGIPELAIFELWAKAADNPVVGSLALLALGAVDQRCQIMIYPPGSMAGTSYAISSEYPDCGDEGYTAPVKQIGGPLGEYAGRKREAALMKVS